ncbi:hypothetical protein JCM18916_495 [Cutibacterium acnes JCM 18916]|nr:hypothetical protein JCM18916_495 [Cutibacterium acnes JCM 18916]
MYTESPSDRIVSPPWRDLRGSGRRCNRNCTGATIGVVIDGVDAKGFTVNVTPVSDPMSMVQ